MTLKIALNTLSSYYYIAVVGASGGLVFKTHAILLQRSWFSSGRGPLLHVIPPFLPIFVIYIYCMFCKLSNEDTHCQKNLLSSNAKLCVCVIGPVIGEFVSQLMPLLCSCLQSDRDLEMRMSIFTMLAKLLLDASNTLDSKG